MGAVTRLAQQVHGPPRHDLTTMAHEGFEDLFQVKRPRLAAIQRDHVDAEHGLQLGLTIKIVEDDLTGFAAPQLDHHAHAVLVGLVAQLRDALDLLFLDQLGNFLEQARLVHLIGQLGDDDGLTSAGQLFDLGPGPHVDTPPAGFVGLAHPSGAIDQGGRGEIRRGHMRHQALDRNLRVVDERHTGIHDFGQVMRRDIGRHPHGDTRRTIHQEVRDLGRQYGRLGLGLVIVGDEVDGVLVDVRQHLVCNAGHADLGVTHGSGRVAIHRSEVALPVNQHVAHGERLRHAHDRVVHGGVAMRVVFTNHITDDTRRLLIRLVVIVAEFAHGVEDASMYGLEAISYIRQCPSHDHAHGVVEVGLLHLVFKIDVQDFFCELAHPLTSLGSVDF